MINLAKNIRFLRKKNDLTQETLSKKIGIKRSLLGAIEEGRTEPRASIIYKLIKFFKISIDDMMNENLEVVKEFDFNINNIDELGKHIRVHQIVISEKDLDKELISLVPISARAGYSSGIVSPSYIKELPKFSLPLDEIANFETYRVFQISGQSMNPVFNSGDYLITKYVENWRSIIDESIYIVITHSDGILLKKVVKKDAVLNMISENKHFEPFDILVGEVIEIWEPVGFISFQLEKI